MRKLREVIDSVMTYTGVMLVLVTMMFTAASLGQVVAIVTGLLLVQLGVWRVASSALPSARTNGVLRDSVVVYLSRVRDLYRHANAQERVMFDSTAHGLISQTEIVIESARRDLKDEAT